MIYTKSSFIYGVGSDDFTYLDFSDVNSSNHFVKIRRGYFSPEYFASLLTNLMNTESQNGYLVTFDYLTLKFTISATTSFTLLFSSGANSANSCASLLGFSMADVSGPSVLSTFKAVKEYAPPHFLQDYIDETNNEDLRFDVQNKSASGDLELLYFGEDNYISFSIQYVSNFAHPCNSIFETDLEGVDNLNNFLRWGIRKRPVIFLKDKNDRSKRVKLILETTPKSSAGTGYELKEMYTVGLRDYYETGILKFRVVSVLC